MASRHQKIPTSQQIARIGLGAGMMLAGVGHWTFARKPFQAQVPRWVPLDKDVVVLASGVVELALGASYALLPQYRRPIGIGLAGFFTAIFPGNLGQYAERNDALGLDTDTKRLVRLFFQPAFTAIALWGAGIPDLD